MECRAYGICLDSQSRGYLGKDRKVSSAAGGNLSRMHKTEETAKESRLNFMYSHLRNRTLGAEPVTLANPSPADRYGLLLSLGGGQHGYRPRPLNVGRHPARFPPRFAASAQAGQAQTAGALAPCRLWYTGTGRQSFRLSPLSASTLGPALLR